MRCPKYTLFIYIQRQETDCALMSVAYIVNDRAKVRNNFETAKDYGKFFYVTQVAQINS